MNNWKETTLGDVVINNEIKEYYEVIDFSVWEKSIDSYCDKLRKLKTNKAKRIWSLKLYAEFLQLIEIFCINIFAITENKLWSNLFLINNQLRNKILEKFFYKDKKFFNDRFLNYFLENWVFGIKEKNKINNFNRKKDSYKTMTKEIIKDYLQDYDLLNAYKHGFRTKSIGENSVSVKLTNSSDFPMKIGHYNTKIGYFKKQGGVIYENSISCNWERIVQKCYFLLNMLENVQKVLLSDGKVIQLDTLFVIDKNKFHKYFGSFRINTPIIKVVPMKDN